jgi:hypothetical protein
MLLLRRGLLGASHQPTGRAAASLRLPQRRSIYADPQGKAYEREGLVMYVHEDITWNET